MLPRNLFSGHIFLFSGFRYMLLVHVVINSTNWRRYSAGVTCAYYICQSATGVSFAIVQFLFLPLLLLPEITPAVDVCAKSMGLYMNEKSNSGGNVKKPCNFVKHLIAQTPFFFLFRSNLNMVIYSANQKYTLPNAKIL